MSQKKTKYAKIENQWLERYIIVYVYYCILFMYIIVYVRRIMLSYMYKLNIKI